MLRNRNIICIANPNWEGNYAKTIVELMRVFALNNKVLYMDYAHTWKDIFSHWAGTRYDSAPVKRILGVEPYLREIEAGNGSHVHVLTPPAILPVNFLSKGTLYSALSTVNKRIINSRLQRSMKRLNMTESPIVVVAFTPALGNLFAGELNESVLVYHCYDEIGASVWMHKHGPFQEKRFLQRADVTITTSQGLLNAKKSLAKRIDLVPNGVNYELFRQGFQPELNESKIVGYMGNIDDRLDMNILSKVITDHPSFTFEFVGKISDEVRAKQLQEFNNVQLTPAQPVEQLPRILKTWSAGLIPFLKNDFTAGVYPLKLNEYLAAGLPVVMTRFSPIEGFDDIVSFEDSPENYSSALQAEIEMDSAEKRNIRSQRAHENDWHHRVERFSEIILRTEKELHGHSIE